MAQKRKQTLADAGADLWDALYNLRDALLKSFMPWYEVLARLLEGSNDEQGTQERD